MKIQLMILNGYQQIVNLRIFNDDNGIMNKSVKEIDGDLQVVSQFTLHALTKKETGPLTFMQRKVNLLKLTIIYLLMKLI